MRSPRSSTGCRPPSDLRPTRQQTPPLPTGRGEDPRRRWRDGLHVAHSWLRSGDREFVVPVDERHSVLAERERVLGKLGERLICSQIGETRIVGWYDLMHQIGDKHRSASIGVDADKARRAGAGRAVLVPDLRDDQFALGRAQNKFVDRHSALRANRKIVPCPDPVGILRDVAIRGLVGKTHLRRARRRSKDQSGKAEAAQP
ncbi:hypothetical protein chiPu_0028076 [Chiloscyllium punctatum]|uniref:Uncharacterized protein n=1 Tax=Chiloscyllium punctatum TaxID=137246 RepID=A0A401TNS0_CHIPU|nr:hypothetical protein [Chiloscyllium punctatum]